MDPNTDDLLAELERARQLGERVAEQQSTEGDELAIQALVTSIQDVISLASEVLADTSYALSGKMGAVLGSVEELVATVKLRSGIVEGGDLDTALEEINALVARVTEASTSGQAALSDARVAAVARVTEEGQRQVDRLAGLTTAIDLTGLSVAVVDADSEPKIALRNDGVTISESLVPEVQHGVAIVEETATSATLDVIPSPQGIADLYDDVADLIAADTTFGTRLTAAENTLATTTATTGTNTTAIAALGTRTTATEAAIEDFAGRVEVGRVATLSSTLPSGVAVTALPLTALSLDIKDNQEILAVDDDGDLVTFVAAANVSSGATSVAVDSLVPSAAISGGVYVSLLEAFTLVRTNADGLAAASSARDTLSGRLDTAELDISALEGFQVTATSRLNAIDGAGGDIETLQGQLTVTSTAVNGKVSKGGEVVTELNLGLDGATMTATSFRSGDYVAGSAGWTINSSEHPTAPGLAEFDNIKARGTFNSDSVGIESDEVSIDIASLSSGVSWYSAVDSSLVGSVRVSEPTPGVVIMEIDSDGSLALVADEGVSIAGTSGTTLSDASIRMTNLPTSDPGVAGRLWNDAGTVKISAG